MNNEPFEKNKKRISSREKKLTRAVGTLASVIDKMASSLKKDLDSGAVCEIKQIKELTGAAKELSGLIEALDNHSQDPEKKNCITVLFEGEGEKWAE